MMALKIKTNRTMLLGSLLAGIAVVISATVSFVLYEHTVNLLTDNLRERLLSITTTQVANIDPKDLEALQKEEDWKKPQWSKVVRQLKRAKDNNPNIVFMYIFRKKDADPSKMEFVVDAESINPYANLDTDPTNNVDANGDGIIEPDGADYLQWPGQDYDTPPEEAFMAYNTPLTNKELYEDSFGQVLTGYAPVRDENGKTIAVLATDIKADDFFVVTRQTLYPFIVFIIVLVIILIFLAGSLMKIWTRQTHLLIEIDRQKDELLSIVSHQLATPVSSVKFYLETLMDGDVGALTKEQREHVATMQGVTVNLADLVSMILDVSRIQLGKMKIEKQELDLNEFFKEILQVIEPKAKEKNVQFTVKMPSTLPKAMLDKRYTRMTVENLLSNAVKYTPTHGKVDFLVELRGNNLYCEVKDTGCGIPKADQDKIFGKLFRASNVRNAVDGNGFGLYVAKGAIEAQGGKIWFESPSSAPHGAMFGREEGKGTKFMIDVPLR